MFVNAGLLSTQEIRSVLPSCEFTLGDHTTIGERDEEFCKEGSAFFGF